ncbi:MAG: hypothetical protein V2A58_12130 [Planctomycetota bacterium]
MLRLADGTVRERDSGWPWADGGKAVSCLLDPTHPLTIAYLTSVFAAYRELGVRYYMIDFVLGSPRPPGSVPQGT